MRLRVGLIGHGAIGSVVAEALSRGDVEGVALAGIWTRSGVPNRFRVPSVKELISRSDVIVEAASQQAVREHGPGVIRSGVDLLIVSSGALADDELLPRLTVPDGGRLLICAGALGGLDILRSAALFGGLDDVIVRSTKQAQALVQPWMDEELRFKLNDSFELVLAFEGVARDAVRLFPTSANIAATVALATIGFDRVRVEIWGDPQARAARHVVLASGQAGRYEISVQNEISPNNPRTSAVTPYSVLRALADQTAPIVVGA